jgi:hypothetical protein
MAVCMHELFYFFDSEAEDVWGWNRHHPAM